MPEAKAKIGRLYGVGVGPGDPELLTVKAQRVLTEVPVIFVPQKAEEEDSLAQTIIAGAAPGTEAKCTGLTLPMLHDHAKLREHWRQAAETIWSHLSEGRDGAFVNVGDPLLYGTFIYVMRALRAERPEVEVEVVPGVTSFTAAAARALLPLTTGHDNIAILSGAQDDETIRNALERFATVVFLKVNTVFDRLYGLLGEMKLREKSVYVRRGTLEEEEIITDINNLKDKKLDYFSLLIVRK